MTYKYFSLNEQILPAVQAVVPLDDVAYSYGFGVYETVRVSNGKAYFLNDHCRRLLNSAKVIDLPHNLKAENLAEAVQALIAKNQAQACNVKILLIGGLAAEQAKLYIMCLNPLFPDRKLYQGGATCVTYQYERAFPQAKTLNMLQSYLAYRQAKQAGAHDALLINRAGCITEGTRSNFFGLKGKTIISPPKSEILPGVTRHYVLKVARQEGYNITEEPIKLADLKGLDGAFLTSTPSKIMPIRSIDGQELWPEPAAEIKQLMAAFNEFLQTDQTS